MPLDDDVSREVMPWPMTWRRGDAPSRRTDDPGYDVTVAGEAGVRFEGAEVPSTAAATIVGEEKEVQMGRDVYSDQLCSAAGRYGPLRRPWTLNLPRPPSGRVFLRVLSLKVK